MPPSPPPHLLVPETLILDPVPPRPCAPQVVMHIDSDYREYLQDQAETIAHLQAQITQMQSAHEAEMNSEQHRVRACLGGGGGHR